MKREYEDYLKDILDSIEKAQQFSKDCSFETFGQDDKTVLPLSVLWKLLAKRQRKYQKILQKNQ